MKRTILIFGLISGAISSLMMVSTIPFLHKIGTAKGAIVGYTAIVLSFMLVFFGIRSNESARGRRCATGPRLGREQFCGHRRVRVRPRMGRRAALR
jgi:ABC-type amino acid transport system permease subunit